MKKSESTNFVRSSHTRAVTLAKNFNDADFFGRRMECMEIALVVRDEFTAEAVEIFESHISGDSMVQYLRFKSVIE